MCALVSHQDTYWNISRLPFPQHNLYDNLLLLDLPSSIDYIAIEGQVNPKFVSHA